jgi:hypothetical protein
VTLTVTLENRDGIGRGVLRGHPAVLEVRTRKIAGERARLLVSLHEGAHLVGEGVLDAVRGVWEGRVSEYAGWWLVSGACGSGTLTFAEKPERAA